MGGSTGDVPNYEDGSKTILKALEEREDCIIEDRNNWSVEGFTGVQEDKSVDGDTQYSRVKSEDSSFNIHCISWTPDPEERQGETPPYPPKVSIMKISPTGRK